MKYGSAAQQKDPENPTPLISSGGTSFSAGLFLLSVAALLLEIMQVRILAITLWPSLVYTAVTLAMLGFGIGGAFLAIFPVRPRFWSGPVLGAFCLCFALAALGGLWFIGNHPIASFHVFENAGQMAMLLVFFSLLALPFLFASMAIGATFLAAPDRVGWFYAVNLVGSGLGCVLFACVIKPLGGEGVVLLSAVIAAAAAVVFCVRPFRPAAFAAAAIILAVLAAALPFSDRLIRISMDPEKILALQTNPERFPDARVIYSQWNALGRTDVAECSAYTTDIPGLGARAYRQIFTDGSGVAMIHRGLTAEEWKRLEGTEAFRYTLNGRPYFFLKDPKVLVIGVGGGRDIELARMNGASSITGVEINPDTVNVMTKDFAEYTNNRCNAPNVRIVAGEGRSFVHNSLEKFDLIQLTAVDTEAAALARGAFLLAENYLFTAEAFDDYFDHLSDNGMVALSRRSMEPPREIMRLVSVACESLKRRGCVDPWKHIIIVGGPPAKEPAWPMLLCKKIPFTADEIQRYRGMAGRINMLLHYVPDFTAENGKYADGSVNHYANFFEHLKAGTVNEFFREYPYDVTPIFDDKPYFYKFFKLGNPGSIAPQRDEGPERNIGLLSILLLAALAIGWQIVLVFVPLGLMHRSGLRVAGAWRAVCYFMCIGFGFMMLEMSFMQKLVLFLGSPIYSVSVTLSAFLVFAGLGSYALSRGWWRAERAMAVSVTAIILLGLASLLFLTPILRLMLGLPFAVRIIAAVVLLAPLAFFMGMPLVAGLSIVRRIHPQVIPWAWGVNGAASVLGSVVVVVTAMSIGFNLNILIAVVLYLLGMLVLLRFPAAASPAAD